MQVYPSSAEEKLGFDVVRARLDALALSALGQDRIAEMRPAGNLAWLRGELTRVAELQSAFRFDDRVPLDHVLDVREVVRRLAPEGAYVGPEELLALRQALGTLRRLKDYFTARRGKYPNLADAVDRITPMPAIEERIQEVVGDDGRVRDNASPELSRLRRLIVRRQAQLRETLLNELRKASAQGYATEEQPTIRNGRMVIPVRAEAKRKVQGFVQDASSSGQTVYIEPTAVLDLNNEVRELEADERREVERILRALADRLRAHLPDLRDGLRVLAQFDVLQAKAHLANQLDAVVPELNDESVVRIHEGRSPVLLLHFQKLRERSGGGEDRHVVPLELQLGAEYRTLVITGPNAGGKTVAMKTVGLLALMLAYGLPIPVAPHSSFCLFDRLMVDIGDEQSIEEDLSTFSSHVANLKRMLAEADGRTLVLIDEAGSGTDPAEGGALAQAVLERLTERGTCTIATTHHGTLKVFAHEHDGVENGSMEFDQETLSPTYRFRAGIPGSSYAFDIADRSGLEHRLLDRARALVGTQKTALEDLITTFDARNQALQVRLAEAEKALKDAEHERRTYAGRAEKLSKEKDEIRRQALEEAQRIVQAANARVERTIREIKEAEAEKEATRLAREKLSDFSQKVEERREQVERRQSGRAAREPVAPAEPTAPPEKRRREPREPAAPRPVGGAIAVGDQVVLDGGSTAAEVIEIEGKEAVITFDSMRLRAKLNRLQKVGGPRKQRITVRQVDDGGGGGAGSSIAALSARDRIDLRGERVEDALQAVQRLLDEAVQANLDRVEVLHGKGTGALRQAIQEYLATRADVASFEEAPWDQGGAGVTWVRLK